jgi:hypothetical protein
MLLPLITTDSGRYQFRDQPFSARTVEAIVAEGIDLAKFDPIPVVHAPAPTFEFGPGFTVPGVESYIVAGDGHSRFEAIRRLAHEGRLPEQWAVDGPGQWDIPCRIVTEAEARTLSWTANLSRDDFTPCEQAKVFQAMLDAGNSLEDVARLAHRSAGYVRQTLALNVLCRDIREAMGLSPEAGGVDAYIGKLLAAKFQQYGIGPAQQQELWHKVLKHTDLTSEFARALLDRIGQQLAGKQTQDVLFALPANVSAVMADLKDSAQVMRRADLAMKHLIFCHTQGAWRDYPELQRVIEQHAESIRDDIRAKADRDASLVARMIHS